MQLVEATEVWRELADLDNRELSLYRRATVGFIFQSFNLVTTLPAWENVSLPMIFQGVARSERKRRAFELLERVGLEKRTRHIPGELSGGEQQRVAITGLSARNRHGRRPGKCAGT